MFDNQREKTDILNKELKEKIKLAEKYINGNWKRKKKDKKKNVLRWNSCIFFCRLLSKSQNVQNYLL